MEALSLLTATVDEEIERIFLDLPEDDERVAPIDGRGQDVARAAAGAVLDRRRRARDPHARRLPPRPDHADRPRLGDPRLRGRAGPPAARAPAQDARRCATWRGCCARSPTWRRPRGSCATGPSPEDWEDAGPRARSSTPTSTAVEPSLLPPGQEATTKLLLGLRAREGRLRAALRAQQPSRLGRHPGRRASRACWRSRRDRHRAPTSSAWSAASTATRTRCSAPTRPTGGVVVRALRPGAAAVVAVAGAGRARGARRRSTRPASSRASWPARELPLAYELDVDYGERGSFTTRDPYAFLPTIGELDLHLLGEGRHEELYERLGAHVREVDGVTGVAFAVWAPAARSVSVVGDFNFWDGRLHPMRALGASGIWELFVPGVGRRRALQVRDRRAGRRAAAEGRPVRVRGRGAAEDRVGRAPLDARVGATTSGSSRARASPTRSTSRCRSTRCTSARGG